MVQYHVNIDLFDSSGFMQMYSSGIQLGKRNKVKVINFPLKSNIPRQQGLNRTIHGEQTCISKACTEDFFQGLVYKGVCYTNICSYAHIYVALKRVKSIVTDDNLSLLPTVERFVLIQKRKTKKKS